MWSRRCSKRLRSLPFDGWSYSLLFLLWSMWAALKLMDVPLKTLFPLSRLCIASRDFLLNAKNEIASKPIPAIGIQYSPCSFSVTHSMVTKTEDSIKAVNYPLQPKIGAPIFRQSALQNVRQPLEFHLTRFWHPSRSHKGASSGFGIDLFGGLMMVCLSYLPDIKSLYHIAHWHINQRVW